MSDKKTEAKRYGAKILEARKRRKWTREALCKRAAVSLATGWRAERGHGVGLETLEKLAKAFGMKLEDLR